MDRQKQVCFKPCKRPIDSYLKVFVRLGIVYIEHDSDNVFYKQIPFSPLTITVDTVSSKTDVGLLSITFPIVGEQAGDYLDTCFWPETTATTVELPLTLIIPHFKHCSFNIIFIILYNCLSLAQFVYILHTILLY